MQHASNGNIIQHAVDTGHWSWSYKLCVPLPEALQLDASHITTTTLERSQVFVPMGSWLQLKMELSVPLHCTFEECTG